ncbi:MAG: AMP-binding protein, partial [Legionellaceae bacterium]
MEKLWLKHYDQGVAHEINLDEYASLVDLFNQACFKFTDRIAYSNMGSHLSFSQLDHLSLQFALYLHDHLGLKKGTRVAIMLPNVLQYPVALFGILRAGCVVVNTNPLYTPDEVTHQLNDAGAQAIVVLANFAHTIEKAQKNLPELKHIIVTELGDLFSPLKRWMVNTAVKTIKRMVPNYTLPQALSFRQTLKNTAVKKTRPHTLNKKDIAFIQYTGGTTGISKGAVLTHGNLLANILQATTWLSPLKLDHHDCIVTALPLYHIFSLTANCLTFLSLGSKNILITNPRDMNRFINDIKRAHFTVITGVNTLF